MPVARMRQSVPPPNFRCLGPLAGAEAGRTPPGGIDQCHNGPESSCCSERMTGLHVTSNDRIKMKAVGLNLYLAAPTALGTFEKKLNIP